jgi:hypothetical protein
VPDESPTVVQPVAAQSGAAAPGEAPAAASRRQRFAGWARTPVGVGVLVAAILLILVTLPVGLASFAAGHEGGGGERGDHGGYGRDFHGGRGDGNRMDGEGRHGPGRGTDGRPQPPAPNGTATPAPSASATTSG